MKKLVSNINEILNDLKEWKINILFIILVFLLFQIFCLIWFIYYIFFISNLIKNTILMVFKLEKNKKYWDNENFLKTIWNMCNNISIEIINNRKNINFLNVLINISIILTFGHSLLFISVFIKYVNKFYSKMKINRNKSFLVNIMYLSNNLIWCFAYALKEKFIIILILNQVRYFGKNKD